VILTQEGAGGVGNTGVCHSGSQGAEGSLGSGNKHNLIGGGGGTI